MSDSHAEEDESNKGNGVDVPSSIAVRSYFVRHRNALAIRADFAPLYVDYYLHWMDHGIQQEAPFDDHLKEALAALVLHSTARPWKETHAWTLNFQAPLFNLFATASSLHENVIGRVFTEGVKESPDGTGLFHSEVRTPNEESRRSSVAIESGGSIFDSVEAFYLQSEQRPARFFHYSEEEYVFISAQPDCDLEWLESLTDTSIRSLDGDEELSHLETRKFRFHCGCSLERIFPAIAPLAAQGIDELFQGDQAITVTCPRCAAKWRLTREQLEAVMREQDSSSPG